MFGTFPQQQAQPVGGSLFGPAPQPTGGSLFNQPSSSFSMAASQAMPTGQPGAFRPGGSSLFSPANPPTSTFGPTQPSTSLFATQTMGAAPSMGFGGMSGQQPGGLFGAGQPQGLATGTSLFPSSFGARPVQPINAGPGGFLGSGGMGVSQPAATGGLFGTSQPGVGLGASTSLFGTTPTFGQVGMSANPMSQPTGAGFGGGLGGGYGAGGLGGAPISGGFSSAIGTTGVMGASTGFGTTVGTGMGMGAGTMGYGTMGGGSLFGGGIQAQTTGYGAPMGQQQTIGTASVPFQKVREPGASGTEFAMHVLFMPQYMSQDKSTEELRVEDYKLRKNGQIRFPKVGGGGTMFGGGMAQSGGILMGQQAGAAPGGLFGGMSGASTLGGPKPGTSLFAPTSGSSLFGGAPSGGSLFAPTGAGAPPSGGLFGAPQTGMQPQGGLMGASSQPGSLFGQPAGQPGGGSKPTCNNDDKIVLGAGGSLFGGQPGSLMGSTSAGGSLFGPKPATSSVGSLFGPAQPSLLTSPSGTQPGGLFGPSTGGSLFGPSTAANAPKPATGSLFGGPTTYGQTNTGSFFSGGQPGTVPGTMQMPGQPGGTVMPDYNDPHGIKSFLTANNDLLSKVGPRSSEMSMRSLTPYDDDELLRDAKTLEQDPSWKYAVLGRQDRVQAEEARRFPSSSGYQSATSSAGKSGSSGSSMYEVREKLLRSREQFRRLETRQQDSAAQTHKEQEMHRPREEAQRPAADPSVVTLNVTTQFDKKELLIRVRVNKTCKIGDAKEEVLSKLRKMSDTEPPGRLRFLKGNRLLRDEDRVDAADLRDGDRLLLIIDQEDRVVPVPEPEELDKVLSEEEEEVLEPEAKGIEEKLAPMDLVPKPPKEGYLTTPDYAQMCRMTEGQLKAVSGFSIRNEHGRVDFEGEVDLTGEDLAANVTIGPDSVEVYPDDSKKPSVGKGLNRPATVCLFKCFKNSNNVELKPEKLKKKLERIEKRQSVRLLCSNNPRLAGARELRREGGHLEVQSKEFLIEL